MKAWLPLSWIVMALIGFGRDIGRHGTTTPKVNNAWISLVALLIVAGILYFGGFFSPLGVQP